MGALSLLELSHAPATALAELRKWAEAASEAEGAEDTEARQLVPTPPSTKPQEIPSPKKKNTQVNIVPETMEARDDPKVSFGEEESKESRWAAEDDKSNDSDDGADDQ